MCYFNLNLDVLFAFIFYNNPKHIRRINYTLLNLKQSKIYIYNSKKQNSSLIRNNKTSLATFSSSWFIQKHPLSNSTPSFQHSEDVILWYFTYRMPRHSICHQVFLKPLPIPISREADNIPRGCKYTMNKRLLPYVAFLQRRTY